MEKPGSIVKRKPSIHPSLHDEPQVLGRYRGLPGAELESSMDYPDFQPGPGYLDLLQFPHALLAEIVDDEPVIDLGRIGAQLFVEPPPGTAAQGS